MSGATIFIVEDDRIIAEDIRASLEDSGYRVAGIAASGEEALLQVKRQRPDLVLMDVILAGPLDGIETARRMVAELSLPVVYLTSHTDRSILQRARETEPFGYLVKPFDDHGLAITIDMALYKHKMEEERRRLTRELQEALAKIKKLEGLIPICAWCKKIRDDQGFWAGVEEYIGRHSGATFTHGMCPDCFEDLMEKRNKS